MTEDDDLSRDLIWALPHSERLALLICSIVEDRKNDPAVAVYNIVKATSVIAQYLNETERFVVAERIRDVADDLEVLGQAKVTT